MRGLLLGVVVAVVVVLFGEWHAQQRGTFGGDGELEPAPLPLDGDPAARSRPSQVLPRIPGVRLVAEDTYEIEGSRPLEGVAELLQRKLGVPVSVEEPLWAFPGDLALSGDLSYAENREYVLAHPGWRGTLAPVGGRIDALLLPPADMRPERATTVIQAALDLYMSLGNPGTFELLELDGGEFSIVGRQVRDETGTLVEHTSPLDLPISFPPEERTLRETLDLIYGRVSAAAGKGVVAVDLSLANWYRMSTAVTVGAANERARDVLARTLRVPGRSKMSWRLRYAPDDDFYGIWHSTVEHEVTASDGGSRLELVTWPAG